MRSETSTARPASRARRAYAARPEPVEELHQRQRLAAAARGTESLGDPVAQHADSDALQIDEPDKTEAGSQPRGVIELRGHAKGHGRRRVDQEVEAEVFLVHEELEIQAIQAGVDVPVDVADVVADTIRTVVRELDADALAGASALALDAAAERAPREQRETLELGEEVRREENLAGAKRRHCAISHPATGSTPSPAPGSPAAPAPGQWLLPSSSCTGPARPGTAAGKPSARRVPPGSCRYRSSCRTAPAPRRRRRRACRAAAASDPPWARRSCRVLAAAPRPPGNRPRRPAHPAGRRHGCARAARAARTRGRRADSCRPGPSRPWTASWTARAPSLPWLCRSARLRAPPSPRRRRHSSCWARPCVRAAPSRSAARA